MKKILLLLPLLLLAFTGCNEDPVYTVGFDLSTDIICVGEEIQFNNMSDSDATSFEWNFGDGNSSLLKDPVHIFTNEGTFEIKLTGIDADENEIVSTQTISVVGCATIVENCLIQSSTIWKNHREGVDYIVNCDLIVENGTLMIEPGVEIEFTSGASLVVQGNGSISAVGNELQHIVFSGVLKDKGSWKGIGIISDETNLSELKFVTISDAGQSSPIPSLTDKKGALTLQVKPFKVAEIGDLIITNGTEYGIALIGKKTVSAVSYFFEQSSISGCENMGYCHINSLAKFEKVTGENNEYNGIVTYGSSTSLDFTLWNVADFKIMEDLLIDSELYFYPGCQGRVAKDVKITVTGRLVAFNESNTTTNPTLVGAKNEVGYWKGLLILSSSINQLELNISEGGGGAVLVDYPNVRANIILHDQSKATFAGALMSNSNSGGCGISIGLNVDYTEGVTLFQNNLGDDICNY